MNSEQVIKAEVGLNLAVVTHCGTPGLGWVGLGKLAIIESK